MVVRMLAILIAAAGLAAPAHAAGIAGNAGITITAAPVKLEFWTMGLKPRFVPYFEALVQRYQASHPNVRLEWVDFPWDILQLKLVTAIAAGKPPALVNLSVPWAEEFARDGLIQPVDAVMHKSTIYTQAALDDVSFGGRIYGFPYYSNVNVIAGNATILNAAGVDRYPRSMDELLQMAAQIAQRTGKPGYAPALGKIDGFFLQEGLPLLRNGKAVFNSPAHVALLKKLAASYQAGGLLKDKLFAEDNFPAVIDAYLAGRLGMMVSAPAALKQVQANAPLVYAKTRVFPAPVGPTGMADGGWLFHFAVPRGVAAAALPVVADFAEYLTGDENQLAFAKIAGVMPTTVRALGDPYFAGIPADAPAADQALAVAARAMRHSHSLYVAGIDDYDELRRILVKAAEAGITGKRDIQQAVDEAVASWNRKLDGRHGRLN